MVNPVGCSCCKWKNVVPGILLAATVTAVVLAILANQHVGSLPQQFTTRNLSITAGVLGGLTVITAIISRVCLCACKRVNVAGVTSFPKMVFGAPPSERQDRHVAIAPNGPPVDLLAEQF